MTLQEQIDALPAWPDDLGGYPPPDDAEWNDYLHDKIGCALARLALAREHIARGLAAPSGEPICACRNVNAVKAGAETPCYYCESRLLLAALEPPR